MKEDTCPICDKGKLKKQVKDKVFKYKGESITIPGYVTFNCDVCGDAVVDNGTLRESGKILKDFQRKVDGMLSGEEIKKIRKKLDLTQEELAEIIGGGLKSVARYESGQVCQSKGMDNLLKILDAYPLALHIIQKKPAKSISQFKGEIVDFQEHRYKVKNRNKVISDEYSVKVKGVASGT